MNLTQALDYQGSMFHIHIQRLVLLLCRGVEFNGTTITGLGMGISFYNGGLLLPLFLDFRHSFYNYNKYAVYLFGDAGALYEISQKIEYSKMFINPGLGVVYDLSKNFGANFGMGMFIQQGQRRDSFISFKLGITFTPGS